MSDSLQPHELQHARGIPDGRHRDQKKTVFIMVADKSSVEPGIGNGEERKIIVNKAKSVGNIWRAILSSCCQNDGDLFLSGNELGRKREGEKEHPTYIV